MTSSRIFPQFPPSRKSCLTVTVLKFWANVVEQAVGKRVPGGLGSVTAGALEMGVR